MELVLGLETGSRFSRRQRLLTAAEFEAVFNHRCSWRTPLFQILARPNEARPNEVEAGEVQANGAGSNQAGLNETGIARLGLVVSKKLLPRSVDRNRMRRKIRETFRRAAISLSGLDVVVRPLALPPCGRQLNDPEWVEALIQALNQAALKCRG